MKPSEQLAALGLTLPEAATPVGTYLPATRSGDSVYTSGQLPIREGRLVWSGKVPGEVSASDAAQAASLAALNAIAAAAHLAGGLDNILRVVKLNVFVNSSTGFTAQPQVANGASDLLVKLFGEDGKHARAAVGVAELPLNAPVEVDLVVRIRS